MPNKAPENLYPGKPCSGTTAQTLRKILYTDVHDMTHMTYSSCGLLPHNKKHRLGVAYSAIAAPSDPSPFLCGPHMQVREASSTKQEILAFYHFGSELHFDTRGLLCFLKRNLQFMLRNAIGLLRAERRNCAELHREVCAEWDREDQVPGKKSH